MPDSSHSGPDSDGLPVPQRYWSVVAIGLAVTMSVLDSAVANVALPTIAREFRVDPAEAIWIVNAYQLAIVVSLLPLASLAEIVGFYRVYQVGLGLFTLASLLCALSDSLLALTLARVLQGFGAAGVMAINGALVRFTYPHRLLGRGVGINALIVSVASVVGPTVASGIMSVGPWQWLFAINLPIGVATFVLASFALPRPPTVSRRFDGLGALLNALAFGLAIAGLDALTRSDHVAVGMVAVAAGIGAGILLVRREIGVQRPLLPLDLLRIPVFALSIATSVCSFSAQMLALVSLPFFFEGAMGRSVVETGLLLTPWPIGVGLVGPLAGSLSDRFPAAILGGIGLLVLATGLGLLAAMPADAATWSIAWRMGVCGIGFGLFQAPNNRTMMASAPRERAGAAGGMLAVARLTGQSLGATGTAVLFAVAPERAHSLALACAAALATAGALWSVLRLNRQA